MKPKPGSKWVVLAALIGNGLIAITKMIATAITGSSAMLSEAVHSIVDTCNQGLLLWGMKRSSKPADQQHPFGYGMELYFWTFVVAILIFAIGAGVSLYEGFHKLNSPRTVQHIYINYIVLGFAMIFEGVAWVVAFREFRRRKGKLGYFKAVQMSKDPTVFTVLFEDSAAMLGLMVAFVGLLLTQYLEQPMYDALASIVIGIILSCTAMLLAYETKGLLIGEAASKDVITGIQNIVSQEKDILSINEILTMHMGPQDILLNISIDFHDNISAGEVERTITRLEMKIKDQYPEVARIFIEAQNRLAHLRNIAKSNNDNQEVLF
ncbi:MAG: cation diffusion facilitator family transporter [Gammaproteobacteria bacterium]|nr:cation diffusion facilitator family transporter [Gammaproteobacteria bacterium]